MTANPTANTSPRGTAEIVDAVNAWRKSAGAAADSYAAIRAGLSAQTSQALAVAGVPAVEAEAMGAEFHESVLRLQLAFAEVESACCEVSGVRDSMLAAVASAKKNRGESTARKFKVVA